MLQRRRGGCSQQCSCPRKEACSCCCASRLGSGSVGCQSSLELRVALTSLRHCKRGTHGASNFSAGMAAVAIFSGLANLAAICLSPYCIIHHHSLGTASIPVFNPSNFLKNRKQTEVLRSLQATKVTCLTTLILFFAGQIAILESGNEFLLPKADQQVGRRKK